MALSALSIDPITVYENAAAFDDFFKNNFQEPSFIFVKLDNSKYILICGLIILFAIFIAGISLMTIFIYRVRNSATASITKIQRSLIISSVAQFEIKWLLLS